MARATAAAVARGCGDADVVVASDGLSHRIWPSSFRIISQHGATFEERFLGVLRRVASEGYRRIVAVGIDTPALTPTDVRRAVDSDGDVVGPSRDGGFYLLGIAASDVDRLIGLPWQTGRVLASVVDRLSSASFLAVRRDVDDEHDVEVLFRLLDRLARLHCGFALSRRSIQVAFGRHAHRFADLSGPLSRRSRAPPSFV